MRSIFCYSILVTTNSQSEVKIELLNEQLNTSYHQCYWSTNSQQVQQHVLCETNLTTHLAGLPTTLFAQKSIAELCFEEIEGRINIINELIHTIDKWR